MRRFLDARACVRVRCVRERACGLCVPGKRACAYARGILLWFVYLSLFVHPFIQSVWSVRARRARCAHAPRATGGACARVPVPRRYVRARVRALTCVRLIQACTSCTHAVQAPVRVPVRACSARQVRLAQKDPYVQHYARTSGLIIFDSPGPGYVYLVCVLTSDSRR
jgi:hypothetical protein